MARRRSGVTLLELMVVIILIGVITGLGLPKLAGAKEKANLRAAKDQVVSQLATARAASIRRGLPTRFHAENGAVWISVQNSAGDPTFTPIGPRQEIAQMLGVTLDVSANADTIQFDGRGFAKLAGGSGKIRVVNGVSQDSVCVTRLGAVLKGGCL